MILLTRVFLFIEIIGVAHAQGRTILDSLFIESYRSFRKDIIATEAREIIINNSGFQKRLNRSERFPCPLEDFRSQKVPTSVHNLKPGDIDIIAALGDSITVGFGIGATNFYNYFIENRGMVFSIGGQATWREFLTLPNILKLYNPKLFGYSLGPSLAADRNSQFNPSETGALSEDMPYMTKVLIARIKADSRVDINNQWKMVTIFIGSNDFCFQICYYKNSSDALGKHKKDLLEVLRLLRDNLPKTFVNIILPPDVSVLKNFTNPPEPCLVTQRVFCPCFVGTRFERRLRELREVIRRFRMLEVEVAAYEEFDLEDFTVVIQPFLVQTMFSVGADGFTDRSYFSVDCFHFSQKTHAEAAKAFWNNILEPTGQKGLTFLVDTRKLKCPSKDNPYIRTNRNSV